MTASTHRLIAIVLLVSIIIGGYWGFSKYWLGQHNVYIEATDQLQDRMQRYQNLIAQKSVLEQQLSIVQANDAIDVYYLTHATPTIAATELQRRASSAVQGNGGNLVSSQILPFDEEEGFTRVAIRLRMTGGIEAVNKAFHALEAGKPAIFIDNVQINSRMVRHRVRGRPGNAQMRIDIQLTTQFELVAYLQQSGNS